MHFPVVVFTSGRLWAGKLRRHAVLDVFILVDLFIVNSVPSVPARGRLAVDRIGQFLVFISLNQP